MRAEEPVGSIRMRLSHVSRKVCIYNAFLMLKSSCLPLLERKLRPDPARRQAHRHQSDERDHPLTCPTAREI
jgi:hypothetical protein